ncbi:hypothetical protein O9992_30795 [Vibrio lentus]|nr:hypothetical protein [Vibrio lentus]
MANFAEVYCKAAMKSFTSHISCLCVGLLLYRASSVRQVLVKALQKYGLNYQRSFSLVLLLSRSGCLFGGDDCWCYPIPGLIVPNIVSLMMGGNMKKFCLGHTGA